mmetsp:Transcript_70897/g.191636  ORF Transcript_70897/g.191636 Transcript_70897/m.191636 type:complete len:329 (-) Transcript_70897:98-1084(-)
MGGTACRTADEGVLAAPALLLVGPFLLPARRRGRAVVRLGRRAGGDGRGERGLRGRGRRRQSLLAPGLARVARAARLAPTAVLRHSRPFLGRRILVTCAPATRVYAAPHLLLLRPLGFEIAVPSLAVVLRRLAARLGGRSRGVRATAQEVRAAELLLLCGPAGLPYAEASTAVERWVQCRRGGRLRKRCGGGGALVGRAAYILVLAAPRLLILRPNMHLAARRRVPLARTALLVVIIPLALLVARLVPAGRQLRGVSVARRVAVRGAVVSRPAVLQRRGGGPPPRRSLELCRPENLVRSARHFEFVSQFFPAHVNVDRPRMRLVQAIR